MQKYNHPLIQITIGIVIAAFLWGKSIAQENTDWKARLFAEAPQRWEDYLRFARSLQISVTATWHKGSDQSSEKQILHEFKQTKGASLRVYQELAPNGEAEAECTNPSYSFKLKRRSLDSGWIITALEFPEQSTTFGDEQRACQEKQLQTICSCLQLWNLWLPTIIHDPDFKITAIKTQEIDGRSAVRFDFDYPKQDKDYPVKGAIRLKGGWMVLDPEHDWILRDYLVHKGQPDKYFMRKTFQIREGAGRHPIITRAIVQRTGKGENSFETVTVGLHKTVEQPNVPLKEFTFSAFDLPEPPGFQVERSQLYLWIALGGIACLGIAALIRWLSYRARGAA